MTDEFIIWFCGVSWGVSGMFLIMSYFLKQEADKLMKKTQSQIDAINRINEGVILGWSNKSVPEKGRS